MPNIAYRDTGIHEIDIIRPLWEQLNEHHRRRSRAFRDHYVHMTFEDRKAHFRRVTATGIIRVDLAFEDGGDEHCVGYCGTSLSQGSEGEIESIFVDESYPSRGIGTTLVNRALTWLDQQGSVRNRVSVGEGNEKAREFYRRFNFHCRMTVLEQKRE